MAFRCLGGRRRLDVRRRFHRLTKKFLGQITNTLEIKGIEDLEGENKLLKLDLSVRPLEDSRTSGDGQVGVLVRQVRALDGYVAVVAEVEAVDGLVAVAFFVGDVLDEHAEAAGYAEPLLQVAGVDLVGERHEVAERVYLLLA